MSKLNKWIFFYAVTLTTLVLLGLYFSMEKIMYLYVCERFEESAYVIRLSDDVELLDSSGRVVGVLHEGVELMSPQVEDLSDTDLSHNMRYKILIDLNPAISRSLVKENNKTFFVYSIKKPNGKQ